MGMKVTRGGGERGAVGKVGVSVVLRQQAQKGCRSHFVIGYGCGGGVLWELMGWKLRSK